MESQYFLIQGSLIGEGTYKTVYLAYRVKMLSQSHFVVKHRALKIPKKGTERYIRFSSDRLKEIDRSYFDVPLAKHTKIEERREEDGGSRFLYLSKLGLDLGKNIRSIQTPRECAKIAYQLLSGLNAAHSKRCLHRV